MYNFAKDTHFLTLRRYYCTTFSTIRIFYVDFKL